jgi:predicted amidophosphoribosyltransferase
MRLGPYDGLLREAVLRMKAAAGEPLAETLGRLWAAERPTQLGSVRPAAVVPVPLHWRRRWVRGYNQSEAVARGVAAGLGAPCLPAALVRSRATPTQRALSPTERWENVKNAFRPGRGEGDDGSAGR